MSEGYLDIEGARDISPGGGTGCAPKKVTKV